MGGIQQRRLKKWNTEVGKFDFKEVKGGAFQGGSRVNNVTCDRANSYCME